MEDKLLRPQNLVRKIRPLGSVRPLNIIFITHAHQLCSPRTYRTWEALDSVWGPINPLGLAGVDSLKSGKVRAALVARRPARGISRCRRIAQKDVELARTARRGAPSEYEVELACAAHGSGREIERQEGGDVAGDAIFEDLALAGIKADRTSPYIILGEYRRP